MAGRRPTTRELFLKRERVTGVVPRIAPLNRATIHGNKLGLDDDVRNCYVYAASSQIPKPYLRYRSAADKARMEADAKLLSLRLM
jgi:hypothetical protein